MWTFRVALIGASVGALAAFSIVFGSFWIDPPGVDPGAVTVWERFRLAGGLALSGGYVGAMGGLLIGFVHGLGTAWATTRGMVPIDDFRAHCRWVRIIGAVVIVAVISAGYGLASALGTVSGADGLLLAVVALGAALVASASTPSIVARYVPGYKQ